MSVSLARAYQFRVFDCALQHGSAIKQFICLVSSMSLCKGFFIGMNVKSFTCIYICLYIILKSVSKWKDGNRESFNMKIVIVYGMV